MSEEEIKSNLCYYDKKNPNNNLDAYDEEDRRQPRNGCGCDNCFYGRDNLAMQILETQRERDELRETLADWENAAAHVESDHPGPRHHGGWRDSGQRRRLGALREQAERYLAILKKHNLDQHGN